MTIYLDTAATTPVDPRVKQAMDPYLADTYGNASSFHAYGFAAKEALDQARQTISKVLHCYPRELIFTGSGTESINLAIQGVARASKNNGKHIITTPVEHHAVLHTCEHLKKDEGYDITYLPVDRFGLVSTADLEKAIRKDTVLISIMYANNEIGTIQNIRELGAVAKKHHIPFHTDACQAAGFLDLDVDSLDVDLLSLNASKVYGPKGVGLLYIRTGTPLKPLIHGGGQEHGLRSGTENIAGIVGFATALEIAVQHQDAENKRLAALRDQLITSVLKVIPHTTLNGHPTQRLPHNAHFSFSGVEGDALVLMLNEEGIYASTGSACASHTIDPSHVLLALGIPRDRVHSALRFTLSRSTTEKDICTVIDVLTRVVEKLRSVSPLIEQKEKRR